MMLEVEASRAPGSRLPRNGVAWEIASLECDVPTPLAERSAPANAARAAVASLLACPKRLPYTNMDRVPARGTPVRNNRLTPHVEVCYAYLSSWAGRGGARARKI